MVRLTSPKLESFTQKDFEDYPVWTWDDERENQLPLSETDPSLEEYDTFFIKAHFETNEHSFDGYLIGGPTFYAFGLFVDNQEFIMNLNLPDRIEKNLKEIFKILDCKPFKLFPLHYESPVHFKGGHVIAGTLNL